MNIFGWLFLGLSVGCQDEDDKDELGVDIEGSISLGEVELSQDNRLLILEWQFNMDESHQLDRAMSLRFSGDAVMSTDAIEVYTSSDGWPDREMPMDDFMYIEYFDEGEDLSLQVQSFSRSMSTIFVGYKMNENGYIRGEATAHVRMSNGYAAPIDPDELDFTVTIIE